MSVQETMNYESFKILKWNRELSRKSINIIQKSMEDYGFILPILVNHDMYILDGQHRYMAAMELGIPIKFIEVYFDNKNLPIVVSKLNSSSRKWAVKDYFEMWLSIGNNDSYKLFKDFIEKSGISVSSTFHPIGSFLRDKIKNGDFDIKHPCVIKFLSYTSKVADIIKYHDSYTNFKQNPFVRAVYKLVLNQNYEHSRMIKKLSESPMYLTKNRTCAEYMLNLQNLYNKDLRSKSSRIHLMNDN